jgi:hypothetical protein
MWWSRKGVDPRVPRIDLRFNRTRLRVRKIAKRQLELKRKPGRSVFLI